MSNELNQTTFDRVARVIAGELGHVVTVVTAETNLRGDLHADSLDMVELTMALEQEFGTSIPDDATTEKWGKGDVQVKDIVAYIDNPPTPAPQKCRKCGCTNLDCSQCIEKTGKACHWVEPDLCSACAEATS